MGNMSLGNILTRSLGKFPVKQETVLSHWDGQPITPRNTDFWLNLFNGWNFSGRSVSVRTTLQLSAAWACVRLISETLSTLPLSLFEKSANSTMVEARDHPLYYLIHSQPNARMTASVFWQSLFASLLLHGNSYVEKRFLGDRLIALDFLLPQHVTWRQLSNGAFEWKYNDPLTRTVRTLSESQMWHLPAFTLDGITGLSPIAYGTNIFGTAEATDEASAGTFRRALKSPGLITMDSLLQPEQREDIRQHAKSVNEKGDFMVLEKGSGFHRLSMNPVDAELLASRGFNIEEICRWYRVQPALVGHGGKDSNWGTGLEEKMSWLVTLTLRPWAKRVEDGIKKDLLSPADKSRFSAKWGLEGLLRGDSSARAEFFSKMTNNGIMTRDECRELENLPPKGGNAAELTVQSAMLPIDKLGVKPEGTNVQDTLKQWLGLFERESP